LVESFRLLHAGGLCYRDVSLANLFFDPAAGDIRICDVDNVGVDDGTSKVLGTPLFMAPEIVRDRTYRTFPSRRTDLHSLAVILFMLLFMEHPLIGRRVDAGIWDDEHSIRHFGADPLFIFSPDDDSNRPRRRHAQQYWRVYPEFLKRPMLTAFGIGLNDPAERVTEGEWIRVLTELRDSMASCPGCGNTVFYSVRSAERETCAACGTSLPKPLVLAAGRRRIVVSRHLAFGMDFLQQNAVDGPVIARAVSHPADHRRLGLKNVSGAPWRVTTAEGSVHRVNPQEAVDLLEGLRMTIGGIDAVVVGV
jgi:DNA-binding helix-hairpin-helix protein with protein kinase domain